MARKLILEGNVQGVFCRNYCSKYARKMNIRGSASNMPDGTVNVILQTDDDSMVNEYIMQLKSNPMGYTFYGTIKSINVSEYNGAVFGDYSF